jgi:hypothetical protein
VDQLVLACRGLEAGLQAARLEGLAVDTELISR